uniref:G_PROTEIN_RECEP_F1_2 domain-containing protein n=1 Tax=Steinernema glaseri TaxID=37863 RepID=A0A1I8AVU0_9BILA
MAYGTGGANVTLCQEAIFSTEQIQYRLYSNMPISVFGIVTNIVNVVVFLDPDMIHSLVNHFLLALSISDLVLLVCNFFFLLFPVMALMTNFFVLHDIYPSLVRYSYPLALTSQTCSVYLTVLVSFHRFLGVCYPFRAKRWVTARPVKFAIFGSVAFSVIINLTTWIELSVEPCFYNRFQRESRHITLTAVQQYFFYGLVKRVIGYTLVMFVIPFFILIFVNYRIIIALKKSTNLRKFHVGSSKKKGTPTPTAAAASTKEDDGSSHFKLLRDSKYSELFSMFAKLNSGGFGPPSCMKQAHTSSVRDRSVTLMLLAIVAMFLGCNGLAFCNNLVEILIFVDSVQMENNGNTALFEKSVEIANTLVSLNSASSIFIYVTFSTKYRSIIKQWIGLEKRIKVNAVALTTAMAAQRALELSIIPDESMNRAKPAATKDASPWSKKIAFRSGRSKTVTQADSLIRRVQIIGEAEESSSLLRTNTIDIADTDTDLPQLI